MSEILNEIEFHTCRPNKMDKEQWVYARAIMRDAFSDALPARDQTEIDHLVHLDEPIEEFARTRLDPSEGVKQGLFQEGQSWARPAVTLAYRNDEPVGYIYSADNVSSSEINPLVANVERFNKMHFSTKKRYAWIREIAVQPDLKHQKIGSALLAHALCRRHSEQPSTAYVWEEGQDGMAFFRKMGYQGGPSWTKRTTSLEVKPFGEDARSAYMYRLVAKSSDVLHLLLNDASIAATIRHQ